MGASVVGYVGLKGGQLADDLGVGTPTYTQADVEAALLTLADLPGYAESDDTGGNQDPAQMTLCGNASSPTDLGRDALQFSASKDLLGPYVLHSVGLVETGWTLQAVRDGVAACFPGTEPDGTVFSAATEADFGSYGDETVAWKITASSEGVDLGLDLVVIRKGNLVSTLMMVAFPAVADAWMVAVAQAAAAKLPH
jgi:hypothetical protein